MGSIADESCCRAALTTASAPTVYRSLVIADWPSQLPPFRLTVVAPRPGTGAAKRKIGPALFAAS